MTMASLFVVKVTGIAGASMISPLAGHAGAYPILPLMKPRRLGCRTVVFGATPAATLARS
jgi:hypothetical protein